MQERGIDDENLNSGDKVTIKNHYLDQYYNHFVLVILIGVTFDLNFEWVVDEVRKVIVKVYADFTFY